MTELLFILGATGCGKSTLLKASQETMPNSVGLVEVGKKLRAMYPPDYFQGSAAPKHTQQLAMKLCDEGIQECISQGKSIVLIDGQPRNPEQAHIVIEKYASRIDSLRYNCRFLHLFATTEKRRERLIKRDGAKPDVLALAMSRLTGDLPALYEVLSILLDFDTSRVLTYNTNNSNYDSENVLRSLMIFARSTFERTTNVTDPTKC